MASTPAEAKLYLIHMDQKLKARNPQIQLWENYYEGIHRLQFATSRFRATFGNLFREFADNWCELIVDASVERLIINGFRSGTGADEADEEATRIWQDNYLDADCRMAHTEAVKLGHAYILVDPDGNKAYDTESPLITIEHPTQAIVLHDAANPRLRVAGLKEWVDHQGRILATVYLPDATYRYEAEEKGHEEERGLAVSGLWTPTDYLNSPTTGAGNGIEWVPRKDAPFCTPNRLKVVSLIPLRNNPTLAVGGRSDIAVVIPVQDAVNKLVSDMMIASEFASFAQRWATGLEVPRDPETGRALTDEQFLASVGRVWVSEHPEAKFGQFEATDLRNYVQAIEMLIQHIAALTRTPPHYLLGQSGAFPSGDSLTATETGLVAKVKSKKTDFEGTWNETIRLAFRAAGDEAKAKDPVKTVWGDPEQRIRSQRIDGAIKLSTIGVPQQALFEEIGADPDTIKRWKAMKKAMGLDENSTEFGIVPVTPEAPGAGPDGNGAQEKNVTEAVRVSRIQN